MLLLGGFVRTVRGLALGSIAVIGVMVGPAAYAAGGGYGPTVGGAPTGPTSAPGGFVNIVTTQTFGSTGGSLHAPIPGGTATLTVPAGAFATDVELEITAPDLKAIQASLPHIGFSGLTVLSGIGVKAFDTEGHPITGTFAKPLTLTITSSSFTSSDEVIMFTGPLSAERISATEVAGSVTLSMTADPDFAVLAPVGEGTTGTSVTPTTPVTTTATSVPPKVGGAPAGTLPFTGEPVVREGAIGAVFIALGAMAMIATLRRRPDRAARKH
jgi:hypothetical protein